MGRPSILPRAEIAAAYASGLTGEEVGAQYHCSRQSVIQIARAYHVPIRDSVTANLPYVFVPERRWDVDALIRGIEQRTTDDAARGYSAFDS